MFTVPSIREKLGDGRRPTIPLTYPGMFYSVWGGDNRSERREIEAGEVE